MNDTKPICNILKHIKPYSSFDNMALYILADQHMKSLKGLSEYMSNRTSELQVQLLINIDKIMFELASRN